MVPSTTTRYVIAGCCLLLLVGIYLGQHFNYLAFFAGLFHADLSGIHPYTYFVFNKYLRFFMNDSLMVVIIGLVFMNRSYVKLALLVELTGLLIIMPVYLWLKLSIEGDSEISSPLLSFIHRLVVNPTLMILLIPALYYQRINANT